MLFSVVRRGRTDVRHGLKTVETEDGENILQDTFEILILVHITLVCIFYIHFTVQALVLCN